MNDTLNFGDWLKATMNAVGVQVPAFAGQIGRRPNAVFQWRNGSHFPPSTVHGSIALVLGVSESEIRLRIARDRRAAAAHAQGSTPVGAA